MKCNMCKEANMNHEFVVTKKNPETSIVMSPGTIEYEDMVVYTTTVNSQFTKDGELITHIYNCEECPNSQLEYYEPENAIAYAVAMAERLFPKEKWIIHSNLPGFKTKHYDSKEEAEKAASQFLDDAFPANVYFICKSFIAIGDQPKHKEEN